MKMFKLASEAACAIIVIPGWTPGLMREIRELTTVEALTKLIVFMPPTPTGFAAKWIVRYESTDAIAMKWEEVRRQWADIRVSLPAYEGGGMVFGLDSSGKPCKEFRLDGQALAVDLAPMRELARTPRASTQPTRTLIPELERLEVPRNRPGLILEILRFVGLGY
jgi:hypothetical protein